MGYWANVLRAVRGRSAPLAPAAVVVPAPIPSPPPREVLPVTADGVLVGAAAHLDGLPCVVTATASDLTTFQSLARDVDHDHVAAGFPEYTPHPSGPLRVVTVRTAELIWHAERCVWTLPGRFGVAG